MSEDSNGYVWRSVATPMAADPQWPNVERFARVEYVAELARAPRRNRRRKHMLTRDQINGHHIAVRAAPKEIVPFFHRGRA